MTHPLLEALQVNEAQFIACVASSTSSRRSAFEEHQTSNEVARLLGEWGYEVHRGLAGTGVVGTLRVGHGKNASACGRMMDALPMQERSGKPWRARLTGVSTAAAMTGTPPRCSTRLNIWRAPASLPDAAADFPARGRALLYGGRVMVEDGLFDQVPSRCHLRLAQYAGSAAGQDRPARRGDDGLLRYAAY